MANQELTKPSKGTLQLGKLALNLLVLIADKADIFDLD